MAPSPKNPSTLVFWNDLENDEHLKTCSLAAKGLWACKLLPIAARSAEAGVVLIGDHPCVWNVDLPVVLANAAGATPEVVDVIAAGFLPVLTELVRSGAASVDEKGRLYNRRMVREEAIRKGRAAAGRRGAEATNEKRQKAGKHSSKADGKDVVERDGKDHGKNAGTNDVVSVEEQKTISARSAAEPRQNAGATPDDGLGDDTGKSPPSSIFMLQASSDVTTTESLVAAASPTAAREGTAADDGLTNPSYLRRAERAAQDEAKAAWNAAADQHGWKRVDFLTMSRRFGLDRIFAISNGIEGFKAALDLAPSQEYLRTPDGGWQGWFKFDWLIDEDHFTKLMEGQYAERHRNNQSTGLDAELAGTFASRSQ